MESGKEGVGMAKGMNESYSPIAARCNCCGRFCIPVEWKLIYSGALPEPHAEIYRCAKCVESKGAFQPQAGIKPEYSCGVIK